VSEGDDDDVEDNRSEIGRHQCFAVRWPNCGRGRRFDIAQGSTQSATTTMLVIDLARVERIDAGGLGVLLGLRESARSNAIMFKLMNATKRVEEILELTHLQHVFEFCSVRELLCLLHRAASMPSCSADQSDENDSRNGSVESYVKAANSPPKSTPSTKSGRPRLILRSYATFESIRSPVQRPLESK
jgi:ABC-type transporter Mla MlaB component